jgi:GNAT superfamily N-acetyltransferase
MTDHITPRQLNASDNLELATKLLQRFFREEGFDTRDDVIALNTKAMAALDACGLFVAEAGSETIGVATVSLEFGIEFGWSAEMGDLFVLPEWRGKGVSRMLVETIETWLREKGATGYQVTVTPYAERHHGLATFYGSLGFLNEGRQLMFKPLDRNT